MIDFLKENKNLFLTVFGIVGLLILLHAFNILTPVENLIFSGLKPVQGFFSSAADSLIGNVEKFTSLNHLDAENKKLKDEINQLKIENNYLKITLAEGKMLESQLAFLKERNYQYVLTRVISKNVDPTYKVIMINKGSNNGLIKGMPVVVENGILIGKLIDVEANRSQVMLLNDARNSTAAQIQNDNHSEGIIKGEFGLSLKMEMIPKDDAVSVDQMVYTSGLENYIPKGLIIGHLSSITKKPGEFFQEALVTPEYDYEKIQVATVIIGY